MWKACHNYIQFVYLNNYIMTYTLKNNNKYKSGEWMCKWKDIVAVQLWIWIARLNSRLRKFAEGNKEQMCN